MYKKTFKSTKKNLELSHLDQIIPIMIESINDDRSVLEFIKSYVRFEMDHLRNPNCLSQSTISSLGYVIKDILNTYQIT